MESIVTLIISELYDPIFMPYNLVEPPALFRFETSATFFQHCGVPVGTLQIVATDFNLLKGTLQIVALLRVSLLRDALNELHDRMDWIEIQPYNLVEPPALFRFETSATFLNVVEFR